MPQILPKPRREKRFCTLWLGKDIVDQLDKMAAQGWSRSAAADEILRSYFAGHITH